MHHNKTRLHLLVMKCQAGDEQSFHDLYECFEQNTFYFILSYVTGEEANDIQQEVWLSVYNHISDLLNPSGFRAWLFQLCRSKIFDFLRRHKRYQSLKNSYLEEIDTVIEEKADELEEDQLKDIMNIARELPDEFKEVVILKYVEGMTYGEISLIVGIPIGSVRSRLYHAKKRIRKTINKI